MTRDEIVSIVTTKTQLLGNADIVAAQLFVSKRYEMIYNAFMWKDTMTMVTIAIDPVNNEDNASGIVLLPQQINRVLAVRSGATNSSIPVQSLESFYMDSWDAFLNATPNNMFGQRQKFAPISNIWAVLRDTSIMSFSTLTNAGTTNPSTVKVIYKDETDQYVVTKTTPFNVSCVDGSNYFEIQAVFKPLTNEILNVGTLASPNVISIAATDLKSPSYQRILISPPPGQAMNLFVLGKKPYIPLDFGSETPAIKNIDNCLIAFSCADMLERARQYGKAQVMMQEGQALLHDLALLETVQESTHQVFQVAEGFGDAIDFRRTWGRIYS